MFWRFGRERDALWRKVICVKFGLHEQFLMPSLEGVSSAAGSFIAKDLLALWKHKGIMTGEFVNGLACRVGIGNGIRFWTDVWAEEMPLQKLFPRVFALSLNKGAAISEVGVHAHGKWEWHLEFRRGFFDWELEQYQSFRQVIDMVRSGDGSDFLFWKGDAMGLFTVKGYCCVLEDKLFRVASWTVPKQLKKMLPSKFALFMWQLQRDRVATKAALMARGIVLPDGGLCSLCVEMVETAEHLFLHCHQVWVVWCSFLAREEVCWVMPRTVCALLLEWGEVRKRIDKTVWELLPYALCWTVWLERNGVIFNDKAFCVETTRDLLLTRLVWWVKSWWSSCPYSMDQFVVGFEHISMPSHVKTRVNQGWIPPQEEVLKFNVDGSVLGSPGKSGIGGILRKHDKGVLGYFSKPTGVMWAYEAEVQAIYNALLFCEEFGFSTVVIESDSSLAVGWVLNKQGRPWKLYQVLNHIDYLISAVNCVGVKHILREGNVIADILANFGRNSSDGVWKRFGS